MATKRTIASVKAEMAKLEAELISLGDFEAKRKEALATITANLLVIDLKISECNELAKKYQLDFSWNSPSGEIHVTNGYWPEVDWNSSNCY